MNSTDYIRLIAFLKRFDCNNREAATYIECLQSGMASVQGIAQRLNSNRITVHSTIQQLIKKGLLFETRKNRKRYIVAESPDVLYRILQRKSNELKLIKNDLDAIAQLLNSIQSPERDTWKVRVYEGGDDFRKILEEITDSQNDICVFTSGELSKNMNIAYLRDYYKRIAEKGIHSRIICPQGRFVDTFGKDQLKYQLQIRLLPANYECAAGFYSWNNNIALESFEDDRIVCSVIHNKDLAFLFRTIVFETFWKIAQPVTLSS